MIHGSCRTQEPCSRPALPVRQLFQTNSNLHVLSSFSRVLQRTVGQWLEIATKLTKSLYLLAHYSFCLPCNPFESVGAMCQSRPTPPRTQMDLSCYHGHSNGPVSVETRFSLGYRP